MLTLAARGPNCQAGLKHAAHFYNLGLRVRVLNLPVMMAFVLSLIWRQVGSVSEAVRTLNREGLLWVHERKVSQQAVEQRLRTLPAVLFERVLQEVLPAMATRSVGAPRAPAATRIAVARNHFTGVVALDGLTLDTLLRKTGLLREGGWPHLGRTHGRAARCDSSPAPPGLV